MSNSPRLTRRQAVVFGAVVGAGCLVGADLRATVALAAQTGKPVFTEAALNSMLHGSKRLEFFAGFANAPGTDLAGYLAGHFTLTAGQIAAIKGIPSNQIAELKRNLQEAVRLSHQSNKSSGGPVASASIGTADCPNKGGGHGAILTSSLSGNTLSITFRQSAA